MSDKPDPPQLTPELFDEAMKRMWETGAHDPFGPYSDEERASLVKAHEGWNK